MNSFAIPLDVESRPRMRLGPVAPSLLVGVIRYGVTDLVAPSSRLPGPRIIGPAPPAQQDLLYDIGFIGSGLRPGASFTLPLSERAFLVARPIVDFLHLDQVSITQEGGCVGMHHAGWSQRYGLWIGIWREL